MPQVAAVVVHYQSPETIVETVTTLSKKIAIERIVIVDNSNSLIPDQFHGVNILADGCNRGYAGGVNHGIRYATDRWPEVTEILVCTHEAVFRDGAIASLLSTASKYPNGHVVAPRLVTHGHDGKEIIWSNGGYFSFPFFYPEHEIARKNDDLQRARWVDGAAFVIDPTSWRRVNGVPEEFFMYMEDVALGELCRQQRIPVLVNQAAVVEQTANGPSRYLAIRNRVMLAWNYMSFPAKAVVLTEVVLRQVLMSLHPNREARKKARESRLAFMDAIHMIRKPREAALTQPSAS